MLAFYLPQLESRAARKTFRDFYRTYQQPMYKMAYRLLRETDLAEDAVQEAFVAILGQMEKVQRMDDDECYAFAIVLTRNRVDHEKYSNIHYEQVEEGYVPGEFVPYHITYIPDGFAQTQDRTTGTEHQETYVNAEGKGIRLNQVRIDLADFDIDTEKTEPVQIYLNEKQPAWYLGNRKLKVIYWDNGRYAFNVSGHVTEKELVKIAESVSEK